MSNKTITLVKNALIILFYLRIQYHIKTIVNKSWWLSRFFHWNMIFRYQHNLQCISFINFMEHFIRFDQNRTNLYIYWNKIVYTYCFIGVEINMDEQNSSEDVRTLTSKWYYLYITGIFDCINKLKLKEDLVAPDVNTSYCTDNNIN